MSEDFFKVPKLERAVRLWIHPEGRVLGSIFVREQSLHHIGEETPVELLNQTEAFLVVHREDLDEYRFYRPGVREELVLDALVHLASKGKADMRT